MDAVISRRQTLQMLASSAVLGGLLLSGLPLAGCGGSGGGGGAGIATMTSRVAVQLPTGFPLPLAELEGGTAFGIAPLDETGFSAKVAANGPTMAYVRHKPTGKFVLFGLVGPGRPGLTPLASAAAAMALALGITGLPGENVAQGLSLLEADVDVKALGDAIASALATDPHALTNGNPAVVAAIRTAYAKLTGGLPPATARVSSPSSTGLSSGGRAPAPLIQIDPLGVQGGFEVSQGADGFILPTNLKRRPATAYTYLVGHTPGAGPTDESPATKVDVQDLVSTTSLLGSLASLGSRPAFAPVPGKPVELPIAGNDEKTHYETVVLMASTDNGDDPSFFSEPRYAAEVGAWRQKRMDLNEYAWIGGILGDIFKSVVGGAAIALSFQAVASIVAGISAAEQAAQEKVIYLAQIGAYGRATQLFLNDILASDILGARMSAIALRVVGFGEAAAAEAVVGSAGAAVVGLATFAAAVLAAAGTLLAVGDVAASYYDVLSSPRAVRWTDTALKAGVKLNPATTNLNPGSDLTFTASLVGLTKTGVVYRWKVVGSNLVTLGDGNGHTGFSFDSDKPVVTLGTTPSTQGTLTVTVEALLNGDSIGKASAMVTMQVGGTTNKASLSYLSGKEPVVPPFPDQGLEWAYVLVKFDPVPGAVTYTIDGTGGSTHENNYGSHIRITTTVGHNSVTDPSGNVYANSTFLDGARTLSPGGGASQLAYYHTQFDAFAFTVTPNFS